MTLGVANRVLYKMALVPLGDYVFFLAQFQTFGCGPISSNMCAAENCHIKQCASSYMFLDLP